MPVAVATNSLTVERNVLGPGVIGHILRNRTINSTSYAKTDRWFAYDQVGSLLAKMDASGLVERMHQDSFGNPVGNWTHGTWDGNAVGWRHNTKEIDGDAGVYQMAQRWYEQATGRFLSVAPYSPMREHEYGFATNDPVYFSDPMGTLAQEVGVVGARGIGCAAFAAPLAIATIVSVGSWGATLLTVGPCEIKMMKFLCNCGPQPSVYCYMGPNLVFSGPYLGQGHPGYIGDTPTELECAKWCGAAYRPAAPPNCSEVVAAKLLAEKYLHIE